MKKLVMLGLLFLAATSFTVVNTTKNNVVGKWKFTEATYPNALKVLIERIRKVNPDQADQLAGFGEQAYPFVAQFEFEYKADGTYEFVTPQGSQTGKWKVNGSYLERINDNNGNLKKDSIISIEGNKMKLYDLEVKVDLEYEK